MSEPITFRATLPPIQSAIKVSGNGDGLRILLDIPESELVNALPLTLLRGKVIVVTMQEEQSQPKKTRYKRQSLT